MHKFKFNKASEGGDSGGGTKSTQETPPPAESKDTPTPKENGSVVDEFGYERKSASDQPGEKGTSKAEAGEKKPAKTEEKVEIKDAASGYGEEPPKVEDAPPPKEEPPKEDPNKLEFEIEVKDLDVKDVDKIKAFAKAHGLTKEAAQAFADMKKSEIQEAKKAQTDYDNQVKAEVARVKASWDRELREDPKFGGEKYAQNVMQVEKVLSEFLTETKKVLTERKTMLPPYVMKDLSKLAEKLYSGDSLVRGDTATEGDKEKENKESDPLAFYT